jgi:hypothetical protein
MDVYILSKGATLDNTERAGIIREMDTSGNVLFIVRISCSSFDTLTSKFSDITFIRKTGMLIRARLARYKQRLGLVHIFSLHLKSISLN